MAWSDKNRHDALRVKRNLHAVFCQWFFCKRCDARNNDSRNKELSFGVGQALFREPTTGDESAAHEQEERQ
jgi:hypothetical protein